MTPQGQVPLHLRVAPTHSSVALLPYGRGVMRGATVGNGVLGVGEGVTVEVGFGVVICACALAKKVTKLTRMHTATKAIPEPICKLLAGCRRRVDLFFIAELSNN